MFKEFSEQVNTDLRSITDLTSKLTKGVNGVRPLLAEADDGETFVTYYVKNTGVGSKDIREWQLVVMCWAKKYDDAVELADETIQGLTENRKYLFVSGEPQFNEQDEINTQLIFNILK